MASNLEKWIQAILNEDAENLSIGSVRSLQMIRNRISLLEKENAEYEKEQERLYKKVSYWQDLYNGEIEKNKNL